MSLSPHKPQIFLSAPGTFYLTEVTEVHDKRHLEHPSVLMLHSQGPMTDGFYCSAAKTVLYSQVCFFSMLLRKSLWSLKKERDWYRCPSISIWQARWFGKGRLVVLLYECQDKLQAWNKSFYPWSGGFLQEPQPKLLVDSEKCLSP